MVEGLKDNENIKKQARRSVFFPKDLNEKLSQASEKSGIGVTAIVRYALKVCDFDTVPIMVDNSITKEGIVTDARRAVSFPKDFYLKLVKISEESDMSISVIVRYAVKVCDFSHLLIDRL